MYKEEKELLLRDMCARLPYGVKVSILEYVNAEILVGLDINKQTFNLEYSIGQPIFSRHNDLIIKPYLRPMSSMTEEEAKEIAILHDIKNILSVKITSDYIDVIVDDGVCSTETRTIWLDEMVSSIKCFDWLNAHHFDYRGLIEKGLALEAPEGMY